MVKDLKLLERMYYVVGLHFENVIIILDYNTAATVICLPFVHMISLVYGFQ